MNLDHLAQLATEATPGKWHRDGHNWNVCADTGRFVAVSAPGRGNDAEFIAAANPSVVLALVEVARAAQGFADHVASEDHGDAEGECFGCGQVWPCFVERLRDALAKLDNLGGTE